MALKSKGESKEWSEKTLFISCSFFTLRVFFVTEFMNNADTLAPAASQLFTLLSPRHKVFAFNSKDFPTHPEDGKGPAEAAAGAKAEETIKKGFNFKVGSFSSLQRAFIHLRQRLVCCFTFLVFLFLALPSPLLSL